MWQSFGHAPSYGPGDSALCSQDLGFSIEAGVDLERHPRVHSLPRVRSFVASLLVLLATPLLSQAAEGLFAPTNLVAWCIVPFDTRKRGPEERAEMLQRLGFSHFAYDWRAEHIPTFDAEVDALQKRHIELTAWWFPAAMNEDAKSILACLERHHLSPQLWVSMFPGPETDATRLDRAMEDAVKTLSPICDAAQKLGSQVALYNHNGWFGEPANLVALVQRLRLAGHTNTGIVYNLHHAHPHIDDFPQALHMMQPYLLAFNLNGMVRDGDKVGKMVLPIGSGDEEVAMIRTLRDSGWKGPVGVLGHTEEDAEVKLGKDLAGLKQVVAQLDAISNPNAGTPKISGRDAGTQAEADWVDNRWQKTDVGPFLASNLVLPDGTLAKGLSIKVGSEGEGTVAYDTALGALRASWHGGFLEFNPGRFGLISAPKPAGKRLQTFPSGSGWPDTRYEFKGLHTHGQRVILEHRIDGVRVLESPWLLHNGADVLIRSFNLDPSSKTIRIAAGGLAGEAKTADLATSAGINATVATITVDGRSLVAALKGAEAGVQVENQRLIFDLHPSTETRRISLFLWEGSDAERSQFDALVQATAPEDLQPSLAGDPGRYPTEIKTVGSRGADGEILAVDTLTMPYDNPWHALLFGSGVDFGSNGEAYVCTIHGDVWRVTGIDDSLRELKWKRYATGLFQPLGLRVREGKVYVLGRDRITRLHDMNGDGEADFYENFTDSIATSTGGHDYVTCLEADGVGNLYYTDPRGVHQVSPDGRTNITLATGWRNPNGLGVSPAGLVTVAPQQGEWTPSSQISEVRQGRYYGYGGPRVTPGQPLGYEPPLCWIPHGIDNSSGSQTWLPEGVWGPLGGHMLHLLWGRCGMMAVLRDTVGEFSQGAVVPLPAKFLSGPNRATFNPRDGALYVAGSTGWQTSAVKDGALQRVRWTGHVAYIPVAWHAHANGITLTFSQPLSRSTAEDAGSYSIKQWNYRYAAQYGSKDWSVAKPDREGRDDVPVRSAKLLVDGRTVFLDLGALAPVMQMEVKWNLDAADGKALRSQLWLSLNKLDAAFSTGAN